MPSSWPENLAEDHDPESCEDTRKGTLEASGGLWRRVQPQPKEQDNLGTNAEAHRKVASPASNSPPLPTIGRHHLRQEPDALAALVRICAGALYLVALLLYALSFRLKSRQ